MHFDDCQGAGTDVFKKEVMDRLENTFKISKRELSSFKYTGIDVNKLESGDIILNQKDYKDTLKEIEIEKDDNKRPLTKQEYKLFRGACGKLSWLSEQTHPDLAYDVVTLTGFNKNATVQNLKDINKVIRKILQHDQDIRYSRVGSFENLKILTMSDAAHLKQENKTKGVAGRFVFLSNLEEKKVVPVEWKSKTIEQVCKLAKAAETQSLDKAVENSIYVARCFSEIYSGKPGESQIPVEIVTDSKPTIDSIKSIKQIEDKLLRPTTSFSSKFLILTGCLQSDGATPVCVCWTC